MGGDRVELLVDDVEADEADTDGALGDRLLAEFGQREPWRERYEVPHVPFERSEQGVTGPGDAPADDDRGRVDGEADAREALGEAADELVDDAAGGVAPAAGGLEDDRRVDRVRGAPRELEQEAAAALAPTPTPTAR